MGLAGRLGGGLGGGWSVWWVEGWGRWGVGRLVGRLRMLCVRAWCCDCVAIVCGPCFPGQGPPAGQTSDPAGQTPALARAHPIFG